MRALVKAERADGLVMRGEPVPKIGPDDILIKVAKTGICGTDLHIWKWDEWAKRTIPVPMVVGHEFSGMVAEIGSHVRTVKVGDRVSGEGHLIGMKSRMARAGHFHLDPETKGIGVNVPGAFAEYVRIPAFNAIHLPPEVDDEIGAILGIPTGKTPVDWNSVIFKSLTIKGIYGREMFETWYKMIAMLQSGLDIRKVITHRMKAAEYARGFALMKQGSCGKVVLDWSG